MGFGQICGGSFSKNQNGCLVNIISIDGYFATLKVNPQGIGTRDHYGGSEFLSATVRSYSGIYLKTHPAYFLTRLG